MFIRVRDERDDFGSLIRKQMNDKIDLKKGVLQLQIQEQTFVLTRLLL